MEWTEGGQIVRRGAILVCAALASSGLGCGVVADDQAQRESEIGSAPGCLVATAGGGFVTTQVAEMTGLGTAAFRALASSSNIDAVIGLSAEQPTRFSDLATSVRLAPSGFVDVRDGDVYRADSPDPYNNTLGRDFYLVADVTSHTYSVFDFFQEVARQYQFRTTQAAVTKLGWLSAIVDGEEGSVSICEIATTRSSGVAYSREGTYGVVPLASDQALLHDGATVQRVDATGRTIAQRAGGGAVSADAAGNVFVANVADGVLLVDAYDPGLTRRWRATQAVAAGAAVRAIATDPSGAVIVAHAVPGAATLAVTRFTPAGQLASQISVPVGDAVALDGAEPVIASGDPVRVRRFTATGALRWSRQFAGRAQITTLAVDPLHHVVFGGALQTAIDFGGGALSIPVNGDGQPQGGFVVRLAPSGAHVFSRTTGMMEVSQVASSGARIAVSGWELINFTRPRLQIFDAAGTPAPWPGTTGFASDLGNGLGVAVGPSGRVWWNVTTRRLPGSWPFWPYLLVLNP